MSINPNNLILRSNGQAEGINFSTSFARALLLTIMNKFENKVQI